MRLGEEVQIEKGVRTRASYEALLQGLEEGKPRRIETDASEGTVRSAVSRAAYRLGLKVSVHRLDDGGLALLLLGSDL